MGTRWVRALKIFSTPQPADHWLVKMPAAPACSSASGRSRALSPVRCTRCAHACTAAWRSARTRSKSAGTAQRCQLSSGRQVGWGKLIITNLPRTLGSHARNAALSARSGSTATPPSTGAVVPGLHASIMDSSVRTRGETRSTCV